ncbi:MATE family efflux transporter [Pseudoruegeria sp. SHC-113]|uniref:MATE family efflux transporter n=1 Tax=Pseudoruegeria sp. SHC-113 TaxID=2855439 RepID=UPI0021BB43A6|nr:MATE family efflux transporter [Pseudoruegeria sp. SHC-113]
MILTLGLPLIGSHLAQFAIGVTDTVMMGWYGVEELAAVVLGSSLFFVIYIFGSGFALAVMPMVAEAGEAGDETEVRRATRMGMWLSIAYSLLVLPLFWNSGALLSSLGQGEQLASDARDYMRIAGFGVLPALLVMALKSFLSGLERTQIILWVSIAGAVLNGLLNWVLIFGNFGAPEMGVKGAALASVIANGATLAMFAAYASMAPALKIYRLFQRFWKPDGEAMKRVFLLGWPISVTLLAEVGLFAGAAVLVGWIGTMEVAAHGIALQVSSATFLVHLGLSNAATVRAGRALGRGEVEDLKRGARVVLGMSMLFASATVVVFFTVPEVITGLFLAPDNPDRGVIIPLASALLIISGFFQLVDGAQAVGLGLLRGVKDTRAPMLIAAFSYWGVGMPASYVIGFTLGYGVHGVWYGLVLGLASAAVLLLARFWLWTVPALGAEAPASA